MRRGPGAHGVDRQVNLPASTALGGHGMTGDPHGRFRIVAMPGDPKAALRAAGVTAFRAWPAALAVMQGFREAPRQPKRAPADGNDIPVRFDP